MTADGDGPPGHVADVEPVDRVEPTASDEGEGAGAVGTAEGAEADRAGPPQQAPQVEEFGWRGWLLVAMLLVSFILIPLAILYLPAMQGLIRGAGLTLRDAYLTLPLIPAVVLAAMAVWVAVRSRAG